MARAYVYEHRVTFDETNLVGNVYFAHYLHWQGHCREHFLAEHAPGVLAALTRDLLLVTLDCAAEFYAESYAGDRVQVHMRLVRLDGNRVAMTFDYLRSAAAGDELVARGRQSVACLRRAGGGLEPVPVPEELRRALAPFRVPGAA